MLDFMMNNKEYEYSSDGNLAAILAQFNSEYVMHVVSDTLEIQFNSFFLFHREHCLYLQHPYIWRVEPAC